MSRCYVYALTDSPAPRLRVAGHTIESIAIGDVHAAVVRLDALPPVSEEALEAQHAVVTRLAARVQAILPMRFGALIEERELERAVTVNRQAITAALDLVRGREQMTVRLVGPAAGTAAVAVASGTSGTDYLRRRREAIQPLPPPQAAGLVQHAVRAIVAAERMQTGEAHVRTILWHLIERGTAARYRAAIEEIETMTAPFQLVVSGPWPPFAFAPELHP